jgi:hypothetical protein
VWQNRVNRKNEQMSPWGMLGGTIPQSLPVLGPTAVPPRMTAEMANRRKLRYRQVDPIAATGPGFSARPPFVGTAAGPRFTASDFLQRKRGFRQTDPHAALSGTTSRGVGSFVGAKLGYLTLQPTRTVDNFTVGPTRTATFRIV